jgi:capsular polysaccharide biosynthesis protein
MEDEIDLDKMIYILWKNRLLILGISLASILVALVISFLIPITYTTGSIVALGNFNDTIYTTQPAAVSLMISDEFLIDVFKELNITPEEKFKEFKKNVKINAIPNTGNLIKISVNSKSKQEGIQTINAIINHFSNLAETSYQTQLGLLSDQMAVVGANINLLNDDLNDTRAALKSAHNNSDVSGETPQQAELRYSRMVEYLQIEENRRQIFLEKYMNLKERLLLAKKLQVVQEPREPLVPVEVKRILFMVVAGMVGLVIGIFIAFLRK